MFIGSGLAHFNKVLLHTYILLNSGGRLWLDFLFHRFGLKIGKCRTWTRKIRTKVRRFEFYLSAGKCFYIPFSMLLLSNALCAFLHGLDCWINHMLGSKIRDLLFRLCIMLDFWSCLFSEPYYVKRAMLYWNSFPIKVPTIIDFVILMLLRMIKYKRSLNLYQLLSLISLDNSMLTIS